MKTINNQDLLFIVELKKLITPNSNLYLSCNHFIAFSLFALIDTFKNSSQINVLLNYDFKAESDFRFIQSDSENIWRYHLEAFNWRNYDLVVIVALINWTST